MTRQTVALLATRVITPLVFTAVAHGYLPEDSAKELIDALVLVITVIVMETVIRKRRAKANG